jgi:hypothetical protein
MRNGLMLNELMEGLPAAPVMATRKIFVELRVFFVDLRAKARKLSRKVPQRIRKVPQRVCPIEAPQRGINSAEIPALSGLSVNPISQLNNQPLHYPINN